jgi:predicted DCC family thiol-disulfide oxidoreductase YuxK
MGIERQKPVLLYDGLCGFCDRAVRSVLRFDPQGVIHFAPLQGEFATSIIARHSSLREVDSLILVEPTSQNGEEQVLVRSEAVLRIAWYMGGLWRVFVIFRVIPRPLGDWLYDVFARSRYRYFGRLDSCSIPPSEVSYRFLD